jgi:K+-transporting ATPase ATPase C chain
MLNQLRPAIVLLFLFTILTGLAYPYAITGLAHVLFPRQAEGSLIMRDGNVVGSELIGQNFTDAKYFHGRPSATTDTDPNDSTKTIPAPYNADNSGGSNYGPTSQALIDRVKGDVATLKAEKDVPVPVDLVTTSASGLDPDITPAAAEFQIDRIAKARGLPADKLRQLVAQNTEGRALFGLLGEPRVNVLKLNLALDAAAK